jgi:hypothetical protein
VIKHCSQISLAHDAQRRQVVDADHGRSARICAQHHDAQHRLPRGARAVFVAGPTDAHHLANLAERRLVHDSHLIAQRHAQHLAGDAARGRVDLVADQAHEARAKRLLDVGADQRQR